MPDLKIYEPPADEPSDDLPVILPFDVSYVPREWVDQYRDRLTQLNNED